MKIKLSSRRPGLLAWFSMTFIACLSLTTAHADEVKPLRSVDFDAQLSSAGFDDAQRAKILVEYDAYVRQFTTVAVPLIKQWAGTPSSNKLSVEEARTLQSKGRTAAQAIDDAERPLVNSIAQVARPDQADAVRRLSALLEIRRDLAFARTINEWTFGAQSFDLIDAIDGLQSRSLNPKTIEVLKPQLDQYLVERQTLVRKLRDATINMPLRRAEAMAKFDSQPRPAEQGLGDAAADQEQLRAQIRARFGEMTALSEAAMAERNAVRLKIGELDIRALESIFPMISGRDQGRLAQMWSRGSSMMGTGLAAGPAAISFAWTTPQQEIPAEAGPKIDQICAAWVSQWWPIAKEAAIKSLQRTNALSFVFDSGSSEQSKPIMDATQVAVDALSLAMNRQVASKSSGDRAAGAMSRFAKEVSVTAAQPGGDEIEVAAAAVAVSVSIVSSDGSGDPIELLEEGEPPVGFEMIEMSDIGELENFVGGMTVISGDAIDTQISVNGSELFKKPSSLASLMDFQEMKPVFVAAGADEAMLAVTETAIEDLNKDARALIASSTANNPGNGEDFGGKFERKPDGSFGPVSLEERTRRAAEREVLRQQLLALETSSLDAFLPAVVPSAGKPVVEWLAPWRMYESERAASSFARGMFDGTGKRDPVRAVLGANLSSDEWKAVGADLASSCAQLAVQTRELASAATQADEAMPMPNFSVEPVDGNVVTAQTIQANDSDAGMERAMKLETQAQTLRKNLQQSQRNVIRQLKERLQPESAQRLQDAWDDQLYARDLKDSTDLSSRFEAARMLKLPEAIVSQVATLEASWRSQSRAIRNLIVAAREKDGDKAGNMLQMVTPGDMAQGAASRKERAAVMAALQFEREETNRKAFRELCAVLGADFSSRLQPLPQSKRAAKRGADGGGAVLTPAVVPAQTPMQSR